MTKCCSVRNLILLTRSESISFCDTKNASTVKAKTMPNSIQPSNCLKLRSNKPVANSSRAKICANLSTHSVLLFSILLSIFLSKKLPESIFSGSLHTFFNYSDNCANANLRCSCAASKRLACSKTFANIKRAGTVSSIAKLACK